MALSEADRDAERAERLGARIAAQAQRYFPELPAESARAVLRRSYRGALSTVFEFELQAGGASRRVMLKLPALSVGRSEPDVLAADRPRVAPVLAARERIESEHAALSAIEARLHALADPRFGWVRVLDFLADEQAMLTERASDPPLKQRLARAHRLAPAARAQELLVPFRNAGAWLRLYHDLPPLEHTRERGASPQEFAEILRRLAEFLAAAGAPSGLAQLARDCARRAQLEFPAALSLGTSHGDLAPRNVLVGSAGRVTLLDTRAAWRAPRWEDLAYFGVSLRSARAQLYSGGLFFREAIIEQLEAAFAEGYFGAEPVPQTQLRLFRIQCLLDRWASIVHAERRSGIAARLRRAVADRSLWRALRAQCALLQS